MAAEIKARKTQAIPPSIAADLPTLPLPDALPDLRADEKAWTALQANLHPPAVIAEDINIDEELICPITQCLMRDPVTTVDGHAYEREAITQWLATRQISPATNAPLAHKTLTDSMSVRKMVDRFLTKNPVLRDSDVWYLPTTWTQALAKACGTGDVETITTLVQRDRRLLIQPDKETGLLPLHLAVAHPASLSAVLDLLERRQRGLALASLLQGDATGQWPLERALRSGQPAATLLKLMAWMGGALETFRLTSPLPASAQASLNAALHFCITQNDLPKIKTLLAWGANANALTPQGQPLLSVAISQGSIAIVTILLAAKADTETPQPPAGDTALQQAIRLKNIDLVRLLCAQGASVVAPRPDGQTPLHAAAQQPLTELVAALCEYKAVLTALNTQDGQGLSPLHYAANGGHAETVTLLLTQKARFDLTDHNGDTALHAAARQGSAAVLEQLLIAGAQTAVENRAGATPQDVAKQQGPDRLATYERVWAKLKEQEAHTLGAQGVLGAALLRQQQQLTEQMEMFKAQRDEIRREKTIHAEERAALDDVINRLQRKNHLLEARLETGMEEIRGLQQKNATLETEVAELKRLHSSKPAPATADSKEVKGSAAGFFARSTPSASPEVAQFLRLVAEGEQDKAEALLKANPSLALASGSVTDLSERRFANITAFQYALWAMDWYMWTMLLKYLPKSEAAAQARALEADGTEHGKHFSLTPLTQALDTYIKNFNAWSWEKREEHWCKIVGGAQRLLPVHVVNEYCRPDRAFNPTPSFTETSLPRTRTLVVNKADDEWFSVVYRNGKIGDSFAAWRGETSRSAGGRYVYTGCWTTIIADRVGLQKLSAIRTQQLESLWSVLSLALPHDVNRSTAAV
jgi:ankyrin repeat protein